MRLVGIDNRCPLVWGILALDRSMCLHQGRRTDDTIQLTPVGLACVFFSALFFAAQCG